MKEAIEFIKGAILENCLCQRFYIKDGLITAYNGTFRSTAPLNLPDMSPEPISFLRALKHGTKVTLENDRVKVTGKKFKAYIENKEPETLKQLHIENKKPIDFDIVSSLKSVLPFISRDYTKPWSTGLYFQGNFTYATNNICMVQAYGYKNPLQDIVIPAATIKELIRIKESPIHVSIQQTTVTFHYSNGRMLTTNTLDAEWPDPNEIFKQASEKGEPISETFFQDLNKLTSFMKTDRAVYFENGEMKTSKSKRKGATIKTEIPYTMKFHIDYLLLLNKIATKIDFSTFPEPCTFFGKGLRGLIMGLL